MSWKSRIWDSGIEKCRLGRKFLWSFGYPTNKGDAWTESGKTSFLWPTLTSWLHILEANQPKSCSCMRACAKFECGPEGESRHCAWRKSTSLGSEGFRNLLMCEFILHLTLGSVSSITVPNLVKDSFGLCKTRAERGNAHSRVSQLFLLRCSAFGLLSDSR